MPLSRAQQERSDRRRHRRLTEVVAEADAVEPEAVSTDDVPGSAAEVIAWIDAAPSDAAMLQRAEVAAGVNCQRSKPWASVSKVTDGIMH